MKKLLLGLAALVVIGGGTGVAIANHHDPKPVVAVVQKQDISYKGVDGKDALTLLKSHYTVETKHYSFGDMVVSINGVKPDSKHFWGFYVNGKSSQVGASSYITKNTDTLEWKLDKQ